MIYKLDAIATPNPLLNWMFIFMSLSIKQFDQVYDELDFPLRPPDELRQIAHDFSSTYDIIHRNPVPEADSIDLLQGVPQNEPYLKRVETLFENTFAYLECIGYAETVYRWGKETHRCYEFAKVRALSDLCLLLRKWVVLEWLKEPVSSEHELYTSDWADFIAKWTPVYAKPTLETLPLSVASRAALQAIILHHETKVMHLETTMDIIMASPKSAWEDFALRRGTSNLWIRAEGRFRIDLREWNMIVDALSSDEMHILEEWILKDIYYKLKIPLPDFRALSSSES